MATTIQNLPDEILVEMLGKLVKKDLKSARLVCTLWSTAGAKWMFQRVYFAPRKTSIKLFTDIAANPNFARNVKELIYDARLFLSEFGTFSSYRSAFGARFLEELNICADYVRNCLVVDEANFAEDIYQDSVWNMEIVGASDGINIYPHDFQDLDVIVIDSLVRYVRLLEQQEGIFNKGKDLKALSEGLVSFRNITKVSAVVDFDISSIYDLHADDRDDQYIEHHQWYSTRSYTAFGLTVPPSKWYHDPRSEDEEQQWWEDIEWDVRGLHSLFRAISADSPRLQELRIGSMRYKAPTTIFQLSDTEFEKVATVARGLTTLSIYPYVAYSDDDSEDTKQHHCLRRLLQEAKKLRSLSSSSLSRWPFDYEGSDQSDFDEANLLVFDSIDLRLHPRKQWPALNQVTLRGACVEAKDLMSILWAHKESLRELNLGDIVLLGEDRWVHFGKEIGQILKLHFVSICRLYNGGIWEPRQTWPRGERGVIFIRDMMQWAHPDELEIEENFGTFTGRLKASLKTDC